MSKKPPKAKAKEPCKPGKHVFSKAETTNGWVIHLCSKCPETIRRPRDKNSSGKGGKAKAVAVAAAVLAALLPVSAAKCGGGTHAGTRLPVHSQKWWWDAPEYQGGHIVFGPGVKGLPGEWEHVGWVRRPPGSQLPRIRVWVQRRQP